MSESLNTQFVPCLDLEKIRNLEICLIVFNDYCEICLDEAFVKLAVADRHRKLRCIFVKHNLFYQSKWSCTIDSNKTQVFLFKSQWDLQHIVRFGRQLKQLDFIREAYHRATTRPFEHLLLDFDAKTGDVSRFCSNKVAPQPTTFYIPSSTPKGTFLTNEEKKFHKPEQRQEHKKRKGLSRVIHDSESEKINFLWELLLKTFQWM